MKIKTTLTIFISSIAIVILFFSAACLKQTAYTQTVVGIDTDSRVKQFKGDSRPVNTWEDRKTLMDSIRYVYDVVGFSTDDELRQQIKDWETDVMIVGSDYKDKNVIGSELVKEVIFFDRIEGYSTTNTLKNV